MPVAETAEDAAGTLDCGAPLQSQQSPISVPLKVPDGLPGKRPGETRVVLARRPTSSRVDGYVG